MKKICIIISMIVILISCGNDQNDGLTTYDGNGFTMRIPEKWKLIKDQNMILPKPRVGTIELASMSKIPQDGFSNALTIISEDLTKDISSSDYATSNNISNKSEYTFYNEVSSKKINFGSDTSSIVYVFDAKYNLETPKARFLQTGVVCGKKGYMITLALPITLVDTLKYEYIFSNFRCK